MQGTGESDEGVYKGTQLRSEGTVTKQYDEITSQRSSEKEHRADALALGAEEGRDKLR